MSLPELTYRLISQVGAGSCGRVYKAMDENLGHLVAVKKSRVSIRVQRTMLRHEARILQLLQEHPAIPTLFGYGQLQHFEYLALELGECISDLLPTPAGVDVKTVVRVVLQVLSALQHLQARGILHRDIKPNNLLRSTYDPSRIFVIDFNLSIPRKYGVPVEDSSNFRGTLHWTSVNGHHGIDLAPRDDLESLAYMAFFLLRGNLPWKGTDDHREPMVRGLTRVKNLKEAVTGASLNAGFPVEFAELLDYSRSLQFEEDVDYDAIIARFNRLADRLSCQLQESLDWKPYLRDGANPPILPNPSILPCKADLSGGSSDEADDEINEGYSNSYWYSDIAEWDPNISRDRELTMPLGRAQFLDSRLLPITNIINNENPSPL